MRPTASNVFHSFGIQFFATKAIWRMYDDEVAPQLPPLSIALGSSQQLFVLDPHFFFFFFCWQLYPPREAGKMTWQAGEKGFTYNLPRKQGERIYTECVFCSPFLERKAYYVKHNNQQPAPWRQAAAAATILTTGRMSNGLLGLQGH